MSGFQIVTKTRLGEWTSDPEETSIYIGGTASNNYFENEGQAQRAIQELQSYGQEWSAMEYKIIPV